MLCKHVGGPDFFGVERYLPKLSVSDKYLFSIQRNQSLKILMHLGSESQFLIPQHAKLY
jgi:hypothetical protein